jgi:hypothetical protein
VTEPLAGELFLRAGDFAAVICNIIFGGQATMRTMVVFRVALVVSISVTLAVSASALDNKSGKVPVQSSAGKKVERLTREECEGLGGKVTVTLNCTGDSCRTVDNNGVVHTACIDKKKN